MRGATLAVAFLLTTAARAGEELSLERAIPLEGVRGRIDHMALSADGNRLAVAVIGNDTVEIVDLKEGRAVHHIAGIGRPTGAVYSAGCLAVASGGDGKLHLFDENTYEQAHAVDVGDDADNVRGDDPGEWVWVGVGEGALAAVEKGTKRFEIPLDAHPESFQLESKGPRIFVNVPDAGHVAVADRKEKKVIATWRLKDAKANYPMALDEEHGRLLVGCRAPPRLLVLDTADGRVVAKLEISGDVDDIFVDPKTRRIYASCGDGFVDVMAQGEKDRYERIARVPTAPGARTCIYDPKNGRLCVAAPKRGDRPAEIRVYRTAPHAPPD